MRNRELLMSLKRLFWDIQLQMINLCVWASHHTFWKLNHPSSKTSFLCIKLELSVPSLVCADFLSVWGCNYIPSDCGVELQSLGQGFSWLIAAWLYFKKVTDLEQMDKGRGEGGTGRTLSPLIPITSHQASSLPFHHYSNNYIKFMLFAVKYAYKSIFENCDFTELKYTFFY